MWEWEVEGGGEEGIGRWVVLGVWGGGELKGRVEVGVWDEGEVEEGEEGSEE